MTDDAQVLAIMSDAQLRIELKCLLCHPGWEIRFVKSLDHAIAILRNSPVGVVAAEGRCWKSLLKETRLLIPAPPVVVVDPLADDAFWLEVLHHGGYDVLPGLTDSKEAFRVFNAAWLTWSGEQHALAATAGSGGIVTPRASRSSAPPAMPAKRAAMPMPA